MLRTSSSRLLKPSGLVTRYTNRFGSNPCDIVIISVSAVSAVHRCHSNVAFVCVSKSLVTLASQAKLIGRHFVSLISLDHVDNDLRNLLRLLRRLFLLRQAKAPQPVGGLVAEAKNTIAKIFLSEFRLRKRTEIIRIGLCQRCRQRLSAIGIFSGFRCLS